MFFAGDSAGHCIPLSGEGIRTAFYFGIAAAARSARCSAASSGASRRSPPTARSRGATRPPSPPRCALQRAIPRLPPRALTALRRVVGRERPCRRAFHVVPVNQAPA